VKSTQGEPLKDEEKEYCKEINHWAVNPSALTGQRLALKGHSHEDFADFWSKLC